MSETRVATQYDRWLTSWSPSAKAYSLLTTVPGAILINTPVFRIEKELMLKQEQRILDVGCGRGSVLRVIDTRVKPLRAPIGIDISDAMLRAGVRARGKSTSPELLRGASNSLPLADESIDVAFCAYMIKHLTDYEVHRFFQELWRVIAPGGLALVWEFAPTKSARRNAFNKWLLTRGVSDCTFRDFEEVVHLAAAAGFEWANNANLRPFLYPPIPRTSVILGKAPKDWDGNVVQQAPVEDVTQT